MTSQSVSRQSRPLGGFALVIALSLMAFVLLLLLSITTLVQVETQSAKTQVVQLQAEQAALLALNQALGTLQAEMGPDQRISANADIFDNTSNDNSLAVKNPYLVGVWDTSGDQTAVTVAQRDALKWEIGDPVNYANRIDRGFRRWLMSDDGTLDPSAMALAGDDSFKNSPNAFKALGQGTLQPDTPGSLNANLADKEIWAPLQEVDSNNGGASARIGWVILDEGVKARMNQPHQLAGNPNPTPAEALAAWDGSGNVGIEAMGASNEFAQFDRGILSVEKVSSFANASLYMNEASNGSVAADIFAPYYHDVSLYASGVMADVVNGGLKRDLSTLAEEKPSNYMDRFLYSETTSGHSDNPNADPRWSAMLDYIGLYKDSTRLTADPSGGLPSAQMSTTDWGNDDTGNRADIDSPLPAPTTYRLAPAVAQFETYFSLLALVPYDGGRIGNAYYATTASAAANLLLNDSRHVYLCITPVITLYNPYNVPIEFEDIWVSFRDIPVGMRFSRYDTVTNLPVRLSEDFAPLSTMNSWMHPSNDNNNKEQRFGMQLMPRTGESSTTLAPGETIVFSPNYPADTLLQELVNWDNEEQTTLIAQPGYSEGIGLFWAALVPGNFVNTNVPISLSGYDATDAVVTYTTNIPNVVFDELYINVFDRLKIELAFADGSQNPQAAGNDTSDERERSGTFSVELYSADPGIGHTTDSDYNDNSATANLIGRYTFDYNTDSVKTTSVSDREDLLKSALAIDQVEPGNEADNQVIAQIELAHSDFDLPLITREPLVGWNDTIAPPGTHPGKVGEIDPTVFASFKVGGKVTKRTAGEPFQPGSASAFTNTSVFSGHFHVGEESPTFSNYNLYITRPLDGLLGEVSPAITANDRGYFFSGYTDADGTPYGTQLEVPVTPLQSIASLQHANIAASGYLPQVSHAVGNSWAHPLIQSDEALTAGSRYNFFDHSYLANTRLWDSYYFSTMADQNLAFNGSGDDFATVVAGFIADDDALSNPTYKRHLPEGMDAATATADLVNGTSVQNDAYLKAAAYQLQAGAFNINSTSVDAWKAILATTNIANSVVKQPFYYNPESNGGALDFSPASTDLAAIYSRFRIPNYNQSFDAPGLSTGSGGNVPSEEAFAVWQGYRELDETVIDQLANDIVDQIRTRGPFLSLADFVNRRLGAEADDRTQMGVIDAAIAANAAINEGVTTAVGEDITEATIKDHITGNDFGMISNPTALSGSTARGVPSYLTQADILQQIGSRLSARSDTFVIRAYGEVIDPISGKVSAMSLCEAVVQRIPDYVDASQAPYFDSDPATSAPDGLSETNERFGRRFKVVQLNWLNPSDV